MLKKKDLSNLTAVRILYVEDDQETREELQLILEQYVEKLYTAQNGQEGLALYKQYSPDIVVTDIQMPEMDGYVLTQHIKSDRRFENIPVVMHSSLSSEANRDMGKRVGVDYYVPKFDAGMLAGTLRPLLAG